MSFCSVTSHLPIPARSMKCAQSSNNNCVVCIYIVFHCMTCWTLLSSPLQCGDKDSSSPDKNMWKRGNGDAGRLGAVAFNLPVLLSNLPINLRYFQQVMRCGLLQCHSNNIRQQANTPFVCDCTVLRKLCVYNVYNAYENSVVPRCKNQKVPGRRKEWRTETSQWKHRQQVCNIM